MCMRLVKEGTKRKVCFYAWKTYRIVDNKLRTAYQETEVFNLDSLKQNVLITSDRRSKEVNAMERNSHHIHFGIHCFLSKKDAMRYANPNREWIVVRVKIDPLDIVAEGTFNSQPWGEVLGFYNVKSIVAMKYELSRSDIDKGIAESQKQIKLLSTMCNLGAADYFDKKDGQV